MKSNPLDIDPVPRWFSQNLPTRNYPSRCPTARPSKLTIWVLAGVFRFTFKTVRHKWPSCPPTKRSKRRISARASVSVWVQRESPQQHSRQEDDLPIVSNGTHRSLTEIPVALRAFSITQQRRKTQITTEGRSVPCSKSPPPRLIQAMDTMSPLLKRHKPPKYLSLKTITLIRWSTVNIPIRSRRQKKRHVDTTLPPQPRWIATIPIWPIWVHYWKHLQANRTEVSQWTQRKKGKKIRGIYTFSDHKCL